MGKSLQNSSDRNAITHAQCPLGQGEKCLQLAGRRSAVHALAKWLEATARCP